MIELPFAGPYLSYDPETDVYTIIGLQAPHAVEGLIGMGVDEKGRAVPLGFSPGFRVGIGYVMDIDEHNRYIFRAPTDDEWELEMNPYARQERRKAEFVAALSEATGITPYELTTGRKVPSASSTGTVPSGNVRGYYAELREKADIVAVAQRLTDMRHMGRTWKGLCPFHAERTPSFVVWPETQTWRCFGACAEGGDVVGLWGKAKRAGLI